MKISIITVCFNSAGMIGTAIESVLEQSYSDIEYIVVDGLSSDGTIDVIKNYELRIMDARPDILFKWLSEPDRGIYDAMNKGIGMATGDIVGILNSDDIYCNGGVIASVANRFASDETVEAVYGDLTYVDAEDTDRIIRYWKSGVYRKGSFCLGWMPPHPSLFVRRRVYGKYGLFNTRFKSAADYEFMLRIIHKGKIRISYIDDVLVKMRSGGKSNSSMRNRVRANMEDRMAWRINNLNPYFFTLYLKPLRKLLQYVARP